ncbi:MAG: NAD(P)H-hydrate dehydratase [Anaerolineaceae bacterium]|nr:NAD(P)H-hydrate dehydratase [Anaerolineaceae bacterium]
MKIVSVAEMVQIEQDANQAGVPYDVMMQNAGRGMANWIKDNLDLTNGIIGLVGSGNNGGDSLIALTHLAHHNLRTFAFLVKQRPDDPLILNYIQADGVVIDNSKGQNLDSLRAILSQKPYVLDGILGTGFRLPLRGEFAVLLARIQELVSRLPKARIIAVDCPSGADCDTGAVSETTFRAGTTLTMAAVKQGLLKYPARGFCGDFHLIEIGIPFAELTGKLVLPELIDQDFVEAALPIRPDTGHKGTFGTCLVMAGSKPYTGAAFLAGKAAYRSGCGLVNIATLDCVRAALAGELIETIWTVLPEKDGGYDPIGVENLSPFFSKTDALVLGPGWGVNDANVSLLKALLPSIPENMPAVFDADGLRLLSQITDWRRILPKNSIFTPHPGEMAALSGLSIAAIEESRWEIARQYAKAWDVVLVLKGAMTAIGLPDGRLYINPVGDSALATAGSGDVLSGVIGGLMAQGTPPEKAAIAGVWLHAKAGQAAHEKAGTAAGVTAMDILGQVGRSLLLN